MGILNLFDSCNNIFPILTRIGEPKSLNSFLDFLKFLFDLDLNPISVFSNILINENYKYIKTSLKLFMLFSYIYYFV